MDPLKRPSGKTYSESMNEWAAQRSFVGESRSRLLHPPWDAHPLAKLVGYLIRLLILLIVPAVIYLFLLSNYTGSKEFNAMISQGAATALQATQAKTVKASWSMGGLLTVQSLEATGGPDAFFEKLEARNLATRIPLAGVFLREWTLPRVSMQELRLVLRSGGLGHAGTGKDPGGPRGDAAPKTGAAASPVPSLMRAGYGINPDFKELRINGLQTARLKAAWGRSAVTAGGLSGMQLEMNRTAAGWAVTGNGGEFSQGWLTGLKVQKLAGGLSGNKLVVDEALFTCGGSGKARLSGHMSLGEVPEVEATLNLETVALQELVPGEVAALLTGEVSGDLKLTGSVNRQGGIKTQGHLELASGRLAGLPVLKMLQQLTGEGLFRLLTLRTCSAELSTGGSPEHGGLVVEVKDFEADCGPLARLKGNFRMEREQSPGDLLTDQPKERVIITGQLRIGISATVAGKLKPAVATRFLSPGEDGFGWLDCPVNAPLSAAFTKELADQMLKEDSGAKP